MPTLQNITVTTGALLDLYADATIIAGGISAGDAVNIKVEGGSIVIIEAADLTAANAINATSSGRKFKDKTITIDVTPSGGDRIYIGASSFDASINVEAQ